MTSIWSQLTDKAHAALRAHRAELRNRTYPTAAFDPPRIPHEVVPVTTADGARLRVHAYGPKDAPPLVLVHGWACAIEYWNAQINAFAGEYRVIAYDQRGHGESGNGYAAPSMRILADDLADVLDATLLPGQQAVLAGHSMGGMTLLAWAARFREQVPERAAAVLLTNTAQYGTVEVSTMLPGLNQPVSWLGGRTIPSPDWLARIVVGSPVGLPPLRPVKWLFARQVETLEVDQDVLDFGLNIIRSCPVLTRSRYGILMTELALGDAARHLTVPTVVLAGARDDLLPPVHSERIAGLLYDNGNLVRHRILPTGHLGNVEGREEFDAELGQLLAEAFARPQVARSA